MTTPTAQLTEHKDRDGDARYSVDALGDRRELSSHPSARAAYDWAIANGYVVAGYQATLC